MVVRKRFKLVHSVGVNDADYNVYKYETVCGKQVKVWSCPYYIKWKNLLYRCYSQKAHMRQPTYKGCTVCEKWLTFSNFKAWMEKQNWEGKELDKDLLIEGNKEYSPETCVFINKSVNLFLINRGRDSGEQPLGVFFSKRLHKFVAQCCNPFLNKQERLGYFNTPEEAHLAWKARKHELACQLANSEYVTDERVANALRHRYK